jgi:HEAT repeat protein
MVIKSSAARDIRWLVAELGTADAVRREAAVARLAIIGPRAVARLVEALAADPPAPARAAILRALEAIGDRRALAPALERLTDSDPRASLAAVAVVRTFLRSDDREAAGVAFEGLTAMALDRARPDVARAAALEALEEVGGRSARALRARVAEDAGAALGSATRPARAAAPSLEAILATLPDDPDAVRAALQAEGQAAPLATLGHLVDALRDRESHSRGPAERAAWRVARGAVHQTLAARGSRLAMYDLRETLTSATDPLPVGFLAAVEAIGDASCVEPIARAWATSKMEAGGWRPEARGSEDWWRRHLSDAFAAILKRERLTRRSPAVKRALARWPKAAGLITAPAARRRP